MTTANRFTLVYSHPTSRRIPWKDSVCVFDDFATLSHTIRNAGVAFLDRIVIEGGITASTALAFFASLPQAFQGDAVYIETATGGLLSAVSPDLGRRELYVLDGAAIEFYLDVCELRNRPTPRKMRVLLAEDENKTRAALTAMLEELGCETLVARSGYEAIRIAEEQRPDVIVVDGLMPEMHGFEVARFVRHLSPEYRPRIVLITAVYKQTRYRNDAKLRYGIDEYVMKPLTKERVAAALFAAPTDQDRAKVARIS